MRNSLTGPSDRHGGDMRATVDLPRQKFMARIRALETAAREWGIRPDYPEGVFLSAMIDAQGGFAELALSFAEAMDAVVSKARAAAEDELARQRVATEETRIALRNVRESIREIEHAGESALRRVEGDKEAATAALARRITNGLFREIRADLLGRQRILQKAVDWGVAFGIGGMMIVLVVAGYVWGTWSDWGMTSRIAAVGSAVERCQLTSKWTDEKGHRLCELSDFLAK